MIDFFTEISPLTLFAYFHNCATLLMLIFCNGCSKELSVGKQKIILKKDLPLTDKTS